MSMYMNNIYSDDMEFEIYARENALEISILNHSISEDLNIYSEMTFFESGDDSETDGVLAKIGANIRKIIDNILNFITGFFKSIGMNVGEKLTVSDYMNANSTKIHLNQDIQAIQKEIDEELMEGHKITKLLSKKTGFDPKMVQSFVDRVTNFTIDNGGTIISTALTVTFANALSNNILGGQKLAKELNEVERRTEEEAVRSGKISEDKLRKQGHEKLAAITKVANSVSIIMRRASSAYGSVERQLKKHKNVYKKKQSKKK